MNNYTIHCSNLSDLHLLSHCYKSSFPFSLSTQLGSRFISKMLEWYIISDRGILFHISDDAGVIIGFCGGIINKSPGMMGAISSISQYAFYDFVKSYLRKPWLLFHRDNLRKIPYITKNILIKFGFFKETSTLSPAPDLFHPSIGLVVIAVSKYFQRNGFGSILLAEFERLALQYYGINRITLTVKSCNLPALNCYLKNGWQVSSSKVTSKVLIKNL